MPNPSQQAPNPGHPRAVTPMHLLPEAGAGILSVCLRSKFAREFSPGRETETVTKTGRDQDSDTG